MIKLRNFTPLTCLILIISVIFISCGEEELDAAEKVFFNGKIYTLDASKPWAEAIYISDGIIKYVGTSEEAKAMASEEAELIDLNGDMMMPGIHDVHMHPLEAASENFKFILDDAVTDPEEYIDDVQKGHNDNPGSGWLLGWGHLLEILLETDRDPKLILDEISTSRPIAVMEQTSHSLWCNSKALELLGFNATSPNPKGGIIMKNSAGEPNGILLDNAGEILMALALTPTPKSMENDYNGLVEFALPELAKNGITSVCEARTFWKRNQQDTWLKIEKDEELTCRINLGLWLYPEDNDDQLLKIKALYSNDPNKLVRINQIKVYSDGIIHNSTAAMHNDYLVNYFNLGTNNGLNYFTEERLAKYIGELEPAGFDFHIHALGNRGIHESLNAIEQKGTQKGRHRITHVEYVSPSDYSRFAALNVTADAQVVGDFTKPENWKDNAYLVGDALANNIIPIKSLRDANARITLSSDWDVSDLNPFIGIQNAVTRAPQNISLEEAVKAYTINAAYTMRQEDKVGSIVVGKEADLIILNQNIFEIPTNSIGQTSVKRTYLQGELVYKK